MGKVLSSSNPTQIPTAEQITRQLSFGLFGKSEAIPLTNIFFDIEISGGTAHFIIKQSYKCPKGKEGIEVEYVFPIGRDMALSKVSITTQTKTFESKITSKEKGEEKYSDAIARGNQAYLLTQEEASDLLTMRIGNLGKGEEVNIETYFSSEMELEKGGYSIRIPTTYIPRYSNDQNAIQYSENIKQHFVQGENITYKWGINLNIKALHPIISISCPTHKLVVHFGEDKLTAQGSFQGTEIPESDLIITYEYENFYTPSLMIQKHPIHKTYAALMRFLPELDAAKVAKNDFSKSKGEFVFILDCSGSMSGERIGLARESCEIFLRSLPVDSYFNVVLFGTGCNSFFPQSLQYSEANLNNAITQLQNVGANLGGTNLLPPLNLVFRVPPQPSYPRNIYILTDGGVSDPESVFELIRKNVDKTRVHTFGIGSGASEQLVKGAAEAGKGGYNFTEGGKITEKVISSLSKGAQPLLTQFSLNFPDTINILHQIPRNASQSVYRNEPFNIFAIFETKSKTEELGVLDGVNLSAFDNYTQSPIQFKLEQGEVVEGEGLFNICVRKLLVKDESLKMKDKVKLSQEYSILCEETAFFAEEKRISEVKTELEVIKVPVAICKTTRRPAYNPYQSNVSWRTSSAMNTYGSKKKSGGLFSMFGGGSKSTSVNSALYRQNYQAPSVPQRPAYAPSTTSGFQDSGTFSASHMATIGVDFKVTQVFAKGQAYKLQMWDTAGQERFRTITQSYYKGANGIIIAYDVTDRNSFNNLDNWLQQVEANGKTGLVVVIAGNKIDLREQRQVTYEEGFNYAQSRNKNFVETSAKTCENIDGLFEVLIQDMLADPIIAQGTVLKQLIIGDSGVGKSSILARCGSSFTAADSTTDKKSKSKAQAKPKQKMSAPIPSPSPMSAPPISKPQMKEGTSSKKKSYSLISIQKYDGSWDLGELATVLGKSLIDLEAKLPPNLGATNNLSKEEKMKGWGTIIAIITLNKNYLGEKGSWQLLEEKAFGWLKSNAIDYEEFKADANHVL